MLSMMKDFRKEFHYEITDGKTVYGTMQIVLIDHLFELVSDKFPFYDSHSQVLHDLYVEMIGNVDIYFRYLHFLDRLEIDEKYAFDWNNIFLKYSESNQNYKETRSSGWGNDSIIFTQIGMLRVAEKIVNLYYPNNKNSFVLFWLNTVYVAMERNIDHMIMT